MMGGRLVAASADRFSCARWMSFLVFSFFLLPVVSETKLLLEHTILIRPELAGECVAALQVHIFFF